MKPTLIDTWGIESNADDHAEYEKKPTGPFGVIGDRIAEALLVIAIVSGVLTIGAEVWRTMQVTP